MNILITGIGGHIGSNLAKWIIDQHPECNVVGIDDLSGGYLDFIPPNCTIYIRDVGSNLDDIFEKYNINIIYHCAAIAAESVANFKRKHYYQSNVINSANLINYSIKYNVDRFVFFSSMAVYGHNTAPFTESQTPMPQDCYGIGKYCVELDLLSAKNQHGLKYTIVRPHSVYGVNQNLWDSYRNVLGIWIRQVLNDEPISIYGDGSQQRAFTYIDDIMEPLWQCGTSEKTLYETFNIGNDNEITILDASKIFSLVVGKDLEIKYWPQPHEVHNAWSDHSKVRQVLNLDCKTNLYEGLNKMWKWAKTQPKREIKTFNDGFELEVGLQPQFKK